MTLRRVTYVTATCDGCGPKCWHNQPDAPPLFADPATARKQLTDEYGWRIVHRVNGRHLMVCPQCANRVECELFGCEDPGGPGGELRLKACSRCGRVRRADAPPAGHPDSLPEVDLPDWMVALDASLFPKETR